jgi:hypothetical protein
MAITTVGTDEYVECAADISALTVIQVSRSGPSMGLGVQFIAAASQPAATTRGLEVPSGGTVSTDNISLIGASGKLWAKSDKFPAEVFTD